MAVPGPASSQQSTTQDPLRITIGAQHPFVSKNGISPGPKTSTGIPNDGQHSNHDRMASAANGATMNQPKSAPLRKDSGFKLPSIAYSPNPNTASEHSDEDDEEEGDDNEDAQSSRSRQQEVRSTMTLAPPKLPLLFFEEDSIGKFDFAYQTSGAPSSTHSQTDLSMRNGGTSGQAGKLQKQKSTEGKRIDPPAPLKLHQARTAQDVDGDSGSMDVKKSSPKPYTPPINTTFPRKIVQAYESTQTKSPEQKRDSKDRSRDGAGARGNSFYWHSPGSGSSDEDEEDENKAKKQLPLPEEQETKSETDDDSQSSKGQRTEPLTIAPIVATTDNSLTSATALGFGGPSDWQHFNDYDAEEVDDLALYISDKPKTAELPAGTPIKEDADRLESSLSPRKLMANDRDTLPTIAERASEVMEENKAVDEGQVSASIHDSSDAAGSRDSVRKSTADDSTTGTSSIVDSEEARQSPKPTNQTLPTKAIAILPPKDTAIDQIVRSPAVIEEQTKRALPSHLQGARTGHTSNPSIQSSSMNSPIDEDDGRERIIISLQVPDSPEKQEKRNQPSPLAAITNETPQERSQERNLTVSTDLQPKFVESPDMLRTGRMSVFPQSIEMEDPYAGLDPWAKASLNRYVKLLKEEAAAQTEEEKFTLFITFMDRERRNRTALYDMDEDSENESTVQFNKVTDEKGKIRSRVSLKRKATPVIPSAETMPVPPLPQPARAETMPLERPIEPSERQGSDASLAQHKNVPQPLTAPPQQTNFANNSTSEESYVMVDTPGVDKMQQPQQQPAAQPRPRQVKEKGSGTLAERDSYYAKGGPSKDKTPGKTGLSLSALKKKALDLGGRSIAKDRNTTPINLQTLLTKASNDSNKTSSPIAVTRQTPPPTNDSEPSADKRDLKAGPSDKNDEAEGRAYEGDKAANRQTIYRPFSGLLRQSTVLRGSNPESKRSSVFDRKSLAAETAMAARSPIQVHEKPFEDHQKPRSQPVNYRYTILEPLLLVVPQEGVTHTESPQLTHLRQNMDSIRDDFSFIHKTVLGWDAEAKKNRERSERERQLRTTQNEAHIDSLFNDNEIGYGDISQLEADFKRTEATKKAEEDREEVATFVTNVFDVVWARINYEMDQLQPLYDQCTELVSNASAGRNMFEDYEEAVPVAPAMEILLILYQKLMVRHQKAFEAVLERDRRLKKTEVAPWYAMGSIEKVKKIEKRFEDAEKKAILEFCRQRDERANLLMDVLDQNTLRGVGANQDYMESIMQAVRKISTEVQDSGSDLTANDAVSIDEVLKAKTITTALARSSEQIVQTFHVADMLLNAADYEVSVANAKLSNADAAAFKRLREAKAKEDNKLAMDLEHRMSLIRGDTARTQEEITLLLGLISKKDNDAAGPGERQGSADVSAESSDRRATKETPSGKGRRGGNKR